MSDLKIDSSQTSLIGGLGMTRITVYDQRPCSDGRESGCPHFHAITTEAYYILEGKGEVEFHDLEKGYYVVELLAGMFLQFPPCTVHRLINTDGLVILGLMGNAGLAENGDARIYFGRKTDEDSEAYAAAVALVKNGIEGALDRRDLAIKGYGELMELWENDREAYYVELKRFIDGHVKTVQENRSKFEPFVANGPRKWARKTEQLLDGEGQNMSENIVKDLPAGDPHLGMCGVLHPIQNNPLLLE
jgi:hypothetical protein